MKSITIGSNVVHIKGGTPMKVIEVDKDTQVIKVNRVNAKGITEEAYFNHTDLVIVL